MKNKRGIIGSFIATFISTIIIIILIGIFIFTSSNVKLAADESAGEIIFNEESLGIENGVGYMENYIKLIDVKSRVNSGTSLDKALSEVKYER